MIKNNSLNKNIRINNLDTINKFLTLKSNENLSIKELNFKIITKDILPRYEIVSDKTIMQKINGFAMSYLLTGKRPFIKAIKKRAEKNKIKHVPLLKEDYFFLNIKVKNKNSIFKLIEKLFTNYDFYEKNLNLDKLENISRQQKNILNYNSKIFLAKFLEQNEFFNANNSDYLLSNVPVTINVNFKNFSKSILQNNLKANFIRFQFLYFY